MTYLLDTNVVSELRKRRCDRHVAAWYQSVRPDEIHLSVLVLGEIRCGVERLRRDDPTNARRLEHWLDELVSEHASRILDINREIADLWGRIRVARPLPGVDSLLAASAIVRNLTLVTRNVRQLEGVELSLLNPFEPA